MKLSTARWQITKARLPARGAHRGAVDAEAELVHVALFDLLGGVLVGAVGLLAGAELEQVAAHGHAVGVKLVEEAAGVALHAQPAQPVGAHGLRAGAARGGAGAARRVRWGAAARPGELCKGVQLRVPRQRVPRERGNAHLSVVARLGLCPAARPDVDMVALPAAGHGVGALRLERALEIKRDVVHRCSRAPPELGPANGNSFAKKKRITLCRGCQAALLPQWFGDKFHRE